MHRVSESRVKSTSHRDIEERTFEFSIRVIQLVNALPRTIAGIEIGKQLIRSGTSVNSNVVQARGGVSRADFLNHMRIALKEAKETYRWILTCVRAGLVAAEKVESLIQENREIIAILTSIVRNTRS